MKQVLLLRDFKEDFRISMDIYADSLLENLQAMPTSTIGYNSYQPRLGWTRILPDSANIRMRCARYFDYPSQAKKLSADVFHIIDHGYAHLMKQLPPQQTVVTVHDIIPILAGKGLIPGVNRGRRSWLSEYSASYYKKAAKIITVSENTKRDLIEHCDCSPDSIKVIYCGISNSFKPEVREDRSVLRRSLGLPEEPVKLILITGNQFYKNQITSLQVFEKLNRQYPNEIKLVRMGRPSPEWTKQKQMSEAKNQIIEIEYLTSQQMPKLYNAVDCLLFPSLYEGFGLPPAEAMASGTPVVVSNAASLPEVVGDAALQCDPYDVKGLTVAVEKMLFDQLFREKRIQAGLDQAKKFTWQNYIDQLIHVYQEVVV